MLGMRYLAVTHITRQSGMQRDNCLTAIPVTSAVLLNKLVWRVTTSSMMSVMMLREGLNSSPYSEAYRDRCDKPSGLQN